MSRNYPRQQEKSQNFLRKSDSSSGNLSTYASSGQFLRGERPEFKSKMEEWEWCKDRLIYKATRESFLEKEAREKSIAINKSARQQNLGLLSTPRFNDTSDAYLESNRHARGMVTSTAYNLIKALNSIDSIGRTSSTSTVNSSVGMNVPVMKMTQNSTTAQINLFSFDNSMTNNSNSCQMMKVDNFRQYNSVTGVKNINQPIKQIIRLTKSVLYPPNPRLPPPTTRVKPPGCKTAFISGLPDRITKDIIHEIFESCGEILQIHMGTKDFCRVRFSKEEFVLSALYFSGYEIKIDNRDDVGYIGLIHIDFAESREDKYEYECQQKAKQNLAIIKKVDLKPFRPQTPPPVVHYSDHGATVLGDKLRKEDTFKGAALILITWLERGDCNKKTSGLFYSMIQSSNSHIHGLIKKKLKYEDELNEAKSKLKQQMQGILIQLNEVEKVFSAASLKKVWDNFTNAQKKNIDSWKQKILEIKNTHVKEVLDERVENEMEVSDDNDADKAIKKPDDIDDNAIKKTDDNDDNAVKKPDDNDNNNAIKKTVNNDDEKALKKTDKLVEDNKNEAHDELKRLQKENYLLRSQVDAAQNITRMLLRSRSEESKIQSLKQVEGIKKQMSSSLKRKGDTEMKEPCSSKKMCQEEIADSEENADSEKDDKIINKSDHSKIVDMQRETSLFPKCKDDAEWNDLYSFKEVQQEETVKDDVCEDYSLKVKDLQKEINLSLKVQENSELIETSILNEAKDKKTEKNSEKDVGNSLESHHSQMEQRVSLGLPVIGSSDPSLIVTESEIRLVSLISTFLIVHPYGASTDCICAYLHKLGCAVKNSDVESIMKYFPTVFSKEVTDVDSFEKNWTFSGFKSF